MIKFYFKAISRNLRRNGVNFFFKLGGFVLALIGTFIIVVYVNFHTSFDTYHADGENIYRINSEWMENDKLEKYAIVPPGIGPELKYKFPEVNAFARVRYPTQYIIKSEEKSFRIFGFTPADSSIFDVFTVKFSAGNKHSLSHPRSIVLTQSLASQIYGSEDPMGKSLSITDRDDAMFEVTGVIEDPPPNSHLFIRAIIPFNSLLDSTELAQNPWDINLDASSFLYVKLEDQAKPFEFTSKVNAFLKKRITPREDEVEKSFKASMEPVNKIHLSDSSNMDYCVKGNVLYVYIFSILGIFLLVMACINYVNLSIVDFQNQVKEINLRKIFGASKKEVAFQIISETVLFCLLAIVLSVGIIAMFPSIFKLLDPALNWQMIFNPSVIKYIGLIQLTLILAAAVYPMYQLSLTGIIDHMKNKKKFGGTSFFNNLLMFTQVTISILAICSTLLVSKQIKFIKSTDPGYDLRNIVVLYMPERYPPEKIPVLKQELSAITGVESVSYSTFVIAGGDYFKDWYNVEIDGSMKRMQLNEVFFDHDFFRTTGMKVVAGRSFEIENRADSHNAFIVNETAVKEFGWENPIGMKLANYGSGEFAGEKWEGVVVGVTKDVNIRSLYEKIEPMVLRLPWSSWPGQYLYVRINGPFSETMKEVKLKYENILPGFTIDFKPIEEIYDAQYGNENKAFSILRMSTWMIVLISSIGIFSLSLYMTMKRMKEFGVRKMVGATARQIALLHVKHFIRIVLLCNVIGLPITYFFMKEWLAKFVYKSEENALPYLLVMILSISLVIVSAGYSAFKAGRMNPLDVIKRT